MNYFTRPNCTKKVLLAKGFGIQLFYYHHKNIVELEIGMTCLRLNPTIIQRVANMMMKASLQLDHLVAANKHMDTDKIGHNSLPQMTH